MLLAVLIVSAGAVILLMLTLILLAQLLLRPPAPPPVIPPAATPEALAATEQRLSQLVTHELSESEIKEQARARSQREELSGSMRMRFDEHAKLLDKGLQEVRAQLQSVGSLTEGITRFNRLLSNVKARGTWGEVQLGALCADSLSPGQYAQNVKPNPRSLKIVEFALVLPGTDATHPVYLPVDAKFPVEDYERLMMAQDATTEATARKSLLASMRTFATQVAAYITPPYTTDFAILFVPTEGLYLEALRDAELMATFQQKRVLLAGPMSFTALVNALQVGFKTLAVQKQASQVWTLLAKVKTDMDTYFEACDKVETKLEEAQKALSVARERVTQMNRKLRSVMTPEGEEEEHA